MGLFKMSTGGDGCTLLGRGMPNPKQFVVERALEVGKNLVVLVRYPDCTNYEGRKVLVYANLTAAQLNRQRTLDPHFTEKGFSPMARFVPTERGWYLAALTAREL